jgi:sugar O-acyltransferase (sialic acid O-acetyltransferase NeuD family)
MVHDAGEAARRHPEADWCVSIGDNYTREAVVERLRAAFGEVRFAAPLLHPGTVIADDVRIGEGTVVMAGAVINPGTTIGRHCIINTRASLDHDNEVDDFCSVAPGVVTGGKVSLGRGSAIGIGACIQHGIRIGTHTVVGAGAVVLADVPDHCVAYGVPCKVVRSRSPSDRYL